MIQQTQLTAKDIREDLLAIATTHLSLHVQGYTANDELLYDVLAKAASDNISIEAACKELDRGISGNRMRELLHEQLRVEQLQRYEEEINAALAARLPKAFYTNRLEAAVDEHDEPYYGQSEALRPYVVRSRARTGTTRFFRIYSLYVIYRHLRLTVAVVFTHPGVSRLEALQRLLARAATLQLSIQVLYADRGFCSTEIITYLRTIQQAAIIACPIRGKHGGTRALCRGRKSYRTPYTFSDGTQSSMAVVATLVPGKNGKRRRKWLLFVTLGIDWKPKTVYRRYRRRFGIETSYRMLRQVRIKTTSRNAALRFFLLGFALLLLNLWAFLRWYVARVPGRGPHRIDPRKFKFHLFTSMLRRIIEQLYDAIVAIPLADPSLKS
jgi:putative transposase